MGPFTAFRQHTPSSCLYKTWRSSLRWQPRQHPPRPRQVPARNQQQQRGGLDDLDVAVFRFTLGIPGFDDALIPRVVGAVGAALLVANHVFAGSQPSGAQVRAEVLGALLAAVGLVTPTLEQLMKEAQPGRGRRTAADTVEGATRVFALRSSLPEAAKQDAAWASFALLRNSNICGVVALWEGEAVLCRGLVGLPQNASQPAGKDPDALLAALTEACRSGRPFTAAYWPDPGSIRAGGGDLIPCIPSGVQSVLLQPLLPLAQISPAAVSSAEGPNGTAGGLRKGSAPAPQRPLGWLILLSERPRALSASERAWAAAVAGKLYLALASVQ